MIKPITIYYKNVYITHSYKKVLVIYNISKSHFLGIPLHEETCKDSNSILLQSINLYYNVSEINEYKYSDFSNILYLKGKVAKIDKSDFNSINSKIKKFLLDEIAEKSKGTSIDNFIYVKWYHDIYDLNCKNDTSLSYKIQTRCIYWVNFGFGVGSELRKIRPAILWRYTKDKKICTFIPLSTSCYEDSYYFHCDIKSLTKSTAKIECMQNFSNKRILEPYRLKGKIIYINSNDFENINNTIKEYYSYEKG